VLRYIYIFCARPIVAFANAAIGPFHFFNIFYAGRYCSFFCAAFVNTVIDPFYFVLLFFVPKILLFFFLIYYYYCLGPIASFANAIIGPLYFVFFFRGPKHHYRPYFNFFFLFFKGPIVAFICNYRPRTKKNPFYFIFCIFFLKNLEDKGPIVAFIKRHYSSFKKIIKRTYSGIL